MSDFVDTPKKSFPKERKSQRKKRLRKRKYLRITRRFLIGIIILSFLAVVAFIIYASYKTGLFNIKHIDVTGTEILTNEQIIKASGIKEGENIFTLNLNEARYKISEILAANEINIKKVLPDSIVIQIKENPPLCVWIKDNKYYYLDDKGIIMEITDQLGKDDTPIITGFENNGNLQAGENINLEPTHKFNQVMNMLELFKQNGYLNDLSEVSLTGENNYRIITKNGVVFTVKDFTNLQEYFDFILTVIENGETNQDINFTISNYPIKKAR